MKKGIIVVMAALLSTMALAACSDASSGTPAESASSAAAEVSSAVESVSSEATQISSQAASETSSAPASSASDTQNAAVGDSTLTVKVPAGFSYNDGWSCWSDASYETSIWLKDANLYKEIDSMMIFVEDKDYKTITCGDYTVYVVENPSGTYGAETQYYIEFGKEIGGYKSCRILVSNRQKDLSKTQTQEIQDMIASISAE